jgi:hypothetical protein
MEYNKGSEGLTFIEAIISGRTQNVKKGSRSSPLPF